MRTDLESILEDLVDSTSVPDVLEALANVCHEKADHLRSDWQDSVMSAMYERVGNRIAGFTAKLHDIKPSPEELWNDAITML
jgi:hypothetical protein